MYSEFISPTPVARDRLRRGASARRKPSPEQEEARLALSALSLLERHEKAWRPSGWLGSATGTQEQLEAWLRHLFGLGLVELVPNTRWEAVTVPAWVNDLVGVVDTTCGSKPPNEYRTPRRTPGEHARTLRAVKRALRAAARPPFLFRAALSAEAARLRVESGVTSGCHVLLREWLLAYDWGPVERTAGAVIPEGAPKTESGTGTG